MPQTADYPLPGALEQAGPTHSGKRRKLAASAIGGSGDRWGWREDTPYGGGNAPRGSGARSSAYVSELMEQFAQKLHLSL